MGCAAYQRDPLGVRVDRHCRWRRYLSRVGRAITGKNRIIADDAEIVRRNPDIIIGSWCGKKFRPENVARRPGWNDVTAVKTGQLFEIKSADILQPGPLP